MSIRTSRARHDRAKAKADRIMRAWVGRLWLGQWNVAAVWEWNGIAGDTVAECRADWRYMTARIRFDVPKLSTLTHQEIEDVVIHELLHAVVNEMREGDVKHEERVVSHLERVVGFLWRSKR